MAKVRGRVISNGDGREAVVPFIMLNVFRLASNDILFSG